MEFNGDDLLKKFIIKANKKHLNEDSTLNCDYWKIDFKNLAYEILKELPTNIVSKILL